MAADQTAAAVLEPYRHYLEVLAQVHLHQKLRSKVDPADVAQQTLMQAHAAWSDLHSTEAPVVLAWLRKILTRVLADLVKYYDRDRRDVHLEQALEVEVERSASGLAAGLAANHTSPSQRAARNEELIRLADALSQLPEPQRTVVIQKHLAGRTMQDIASDLDKTIPAVASLLRRGLEELRQRMSPPDEAGR
jgi:RNA polymerase sigma-70 factor (subfamily 1)